MRPLYCRMMKSNSVGNGRSSSRYTLTSAFADLHIKYTSFTQNRMDFDIGSTLQAIVDGTDPFLEEFGITGPRLIPLPSHIVDAMIDPLVSGTDPFHLNLQSEANSLIGHDGRNLSNYVTENATVESVPLDLGEDSITVEDSITGTASSYSEEPGFGGFRATYGGPDGSTAGGQAGETAGGGIRPFVDEGEGTAGGLFPEEELSFEESRQEGQGQWDQPPDDEPSASELTETELTETEESTVDLAEEAGELDSGKGLGGGRVREPSDPFAAEPNAIEMMPLADRPSPVELSNAAAHGLEVPEIRTGLSQLIGAAREQGFSGAAIAQDMGIGMGSAGEWWINRATFSGYLNKQLKGSVIGIPLGPLIAWMESHAKGSGSLLSLGLIGQDVLTTGDPLGLLLIAVGELWKVKGEARQKVIDNDTPDKDYGSRMGYVREGDTWYPAFFNKRFQSTGLFAGDMEMTMDYGHDIVWFMNGEGTWIPQMAGAKSKDFVANSIEFDNTTWAGGRQYAFASKDFLHDTGTGSSGLGTGDVLRDWYFLSDDDAKKVMTGDFEMKQYDEDVTTFNPPARQINDWRKALDVGQDWKWSTAVERMGSGAAVNTYEGSRGMQRLLFETSTKALSLSTELDYGEYVKQMAAGNDDAVYPDTGKKIQRPTDVFHDYIFNTVLKDHLKTLYKTQRLAAKEAEFDMLYQNDRGRALNNSEQYETKWLEEKDHATIWSSMYLDTTKDLPTAKSSEELEVQMHQIEMLNDRTPLQRNYLAQKAQTRYWMQQSVEMGEGDQLMHFLYGRDWGITGGAADPYEMHEYTTRTGALYTEMMKGVDESLWDDIGKSLYFSADQVVGFAAPWQNAGEDLIPTFTGTLKDQDVTEYMEDFRAKAYTRMSQEARDNTTLFLKSTGNLSDPNMLLEGKDVLLREGGLLSIEDPDQGADEAGGKKVTFEDEAVDPEKIKALKEGTDVGFLHIEDDPNKDALPELEKVEEDTSQDWRPDYHVDPIEEMSIDAVRELYGDADADAEQERRDARDADARDAENAEKLAKVQSFMPEDWTFESFGPPVVYRSPDGTIFNDWGNGPIATIGGHEITIEEYLGALDHAKKQIDIDDDGIPDHIEDWINTGKKLGLLAEDYQHGDEVVAAADADEPEHKGAAVDALPTVDDEFVDAPRMSTKYATAIALAERTGETKLV